MVREDNPFQTWVASKGIEIRASGVLGAGRGAFALAALPPNTIIGLYRGETLTPEQYDAKYPHGALASFVLQTGLRRFIDASNEAQANWTRYINDCRGSGLSNNVEFTVRGGVRTKRRIRAGEELLVDYGPEYF